MYINSNYITDRSLYDAALISQANGTMERMGKIPEGYARIAVLNHPGFPSTQLVFARFNGFNPSDMEYRISMNQTACAKIQQNPIAMNHTTDRDKPVGTIHFPQAGCSRASVEEYLKRYGSGTFDIQLRNRNDLKSLHNIVNQHSERWERDPREHINLQGSQEYYQAYMILLATGYYTNFSIIGFNY